MIDLRSDTVTMPCDAMRRAMAAAEVGDDVYDEDPTVKRLEARLAAMAGMDAALFFPSGTQSNLVALLSHCARGDEYLVAQHAHTYRFEGGGAAVLGGIQPQPLEAEGDGSLDLDKVAAAVKADDFHFAKTRLLALENTTGGRVLSLAYMQQAREVADRHGLGLHLDGARAFNAAVALGVELAEVAAPFDSVSVCLSKGLGAPVGSLLCAGDGLIDRARRWRKMTGGGMRQCGVLAAAGLVALDNNIARLADDHARADRLADNLQRLDGVRVIDNRAHTNMVFMQLPGRGNHALDALRRHAAARGLRLGERAGDDAIRLVTHLHISDADIDKATAVIGEFVGAL